MATGAAWAVELTGFGKSYAASGRAGRAQVIHDFSLQVSSGQVVGLLGPNGSGKSTTLKALAGLVSADAGQCRVLGHAAGSDAARASVGYLPETVRFPLRQTGRELLHFCAGLTAMPAVRVGARVAEVLDWSGLGAAADRRVGEYSKGMRQRLGLAQAIVHEPAVVLLDEPASGLDPEGRLALNALIRDLARQGRTVLFSSHLLAQAEQLCDRIVLLGGGRVLADGTPAGLLGASRGEAAAPSPLETLYLEKLRGR